MPSRDLHMRMAFGELEIEFTAENQSYSPDVVQDLRNRVLEAFIAAVRELHTLGYDMDDDTDDDDADSALTEGTTDDS